MTLWPLFYFHKAGNKQQLPLNKYVQMYNVPKTQSWVIRPPVTAPRCSVLTTQSSDTEMTPVHTQREQTKPSKRAGGFFIAKALWVSEKIHQ